MVDEASKPDANRDFVGGADELAAGVHRAGIDDAAKLPRHGGGEFRRDFDLTFELEAPG